MAKVQFAEFAAVSSQKAGVFGEIARSHVQTRHTNLSSTHHPPHNKMSVALNPSTSLGFPRPLTQLVKRSLTISNNNAQPIAFKVKTTAPKLYCVRPNSGRVEPGQSVEVSVMLQAMKEEPPLNAKCKDKFLIQSTLITPEKETMSLQDIWSAREGVDEASKVHQQKLRVTYLQQEGQSLPEEVEPMPAQNSEATARPQQFVSEHVNGHHQPTASGAAEDATSQPARQPFQPQDLPRSVTPHHEYSVAREESHDLDDHSREVPIEVLQPPPHDLPTTTPFTEHEASTGFAAEPGHDAFPIPTREQEEPAAAPAPVPVPPPVSSRRASGQAPASPTSQIQNIESHPAFRHLASQYNLALSEIEHLRDELTTTSIAAESELRRRTKAQSEVGSVVTDTDVVEDTAFHQEGVPLQVVVIIALAVFITTYLFL
ncbi:hypothetical protein AX17_006242 [Amanita inopinata Kibby_2008]|nr:hypothetical protein AX17_006242 [Amanita inopinata Kibby_2008]